MKRKTAALLLSALVLPGIGQLYLGRKAVGGIIVVLVNLLLLLGLFVLLRALSPVIAVQIAGGAVSLSPGEVLKALDKSSAFGRGVLAGYFALWAFSLVDIIRYRDD